MKRNGRPISGTGRVMASFIILACFAACDPEDVVTTLGEFEIPRRFTNNRTESIYIAMPDGVQLAVDITLPQPLAAGEEVPTIVMMTRHWRAAERLRRTSAWVLARRSRGAKLVRALG